MNALFITILKITADGIRAIESQRLHLSRKIHTYPGLEFKVLYAGEAFAQLSVYGYNMGTTMVLRSGAHCGDKIGVKYHTPVLIETDGGFAGVLCSYVLQISKQPVSVNQLCDLIGIDASQKISAECYRNLRKKLFLTQRVAEFSELMDYVERDETVYRDTARMIGHTRLYRENFFSDRLPAGRGAVSFQEDLTLSAAKPHTDKGKHVAVLNFANPVEPGGGVLRGANAQEENLCRSSNLYKSLVSENASKYYELNLDVLRENPSNSFFIGTDLVLYSPGVLVLKDSVGYRPGLGGDVAEVYRDSPYHVDVLTCAAPFFSSPDHMLPNGDLENLLKRRIRNIFEAAIENDIEVLILGAFGCGAFHNPPDVVAGAFREVLLEDRYAKAFDEVIFAVKGTRVLRCPNVEAFEHAFCAFPGIMENGNGKMR